MCNELSASRSVTGLRFQFTDLRSISGMSRLALYTGSYGIKIKIIYTESNGLCFFFVIKFNNLAMKVRPFNEENKISCFFNDSGWYYDNFSK